MNHRIVSQTITKLRYVRSLAVALHKIITRKDDFRTSKVHQNR